MLPGSKWPTMVGCEVVVVGVSSVGSCFDRIGGSGSARSPATVRRVRRSAVDRTRLLGVRPIPTTTVIAA
jgi:hypothetical protein